jgi:hypothetical protein
MRQPGPAPSPGLVATRAAKAATTSIPIVFGVGNDRRSPSAQPSTHATRLTHRSSARRHRSPSPLAVSSSSSEHNECNRCWCGRIWFHRCISDEYHFRSCRYYPHWKWVSAGYYELISFAFIALSYPVYRWTRLAVFPHRISTVEKWRTYGCIGYRWMRPRAHVSAGSKSFTRKPLHLGDTEGINVFRSFRPKHADGRAFALISYSGNQPFLINEEVGDAGEERADHATVTIHVAAAP